MDNSFYDSSQSQSPTVFTGNSTACHLHTNGTIGTPWLHGFKNFKAPVRYTVQVPLARRNSNNAVKFAKAFIDAMPAKVNQLDAIEIGNEPNFYTTYPPIRCGDLDRSKCWGPSDYSKEWHQYAAKFVTEIDQLQGNTKWFQALTYSSNVNQNKWNV